MTGSPTSSTPSALARTRDAWHRLAEHVVSPARHAVTGRIGLRPAFGGFSTPPFGEDGRVVAVDGAELVVTALGAETRRAPITTVRQAGAFVGVEPGAPSDVYAPTTALDLDAWLGVEVEAAKILAGWFALGSGALRRFAEAHAEDEPSAAQLWPEHFDLALTAAAVNYGVSPGDAHVAEPYLYVGPHHLPPGGDPFFTRAFGAVRTIGEITSVEEALAFFEAGWEHTRHTPPPGGGGE